MFQMKEKDKNAIRRTIRGGNKQSTQQRVQHNNHKDIQCIWEKNTVRSLTRAKYIKNHTEPEKYKN